jgi:chromate transport protein ChrA
LFDRTAFISGGGSDTLRSIVVLIVIITILSASPIEATVKGLVALALSVVALLVGVRKSLGERLEQSNIASTECSIIHVDDVALKSPSRLARLLVGSVVTGAVIAVVVAVLVSSLASQLLSRLG